MQGAQAFELRSEGCIDTTADKEEGRKLQGRACVKPMGWEESAHLVNRKVSEL